MARPRKNPLPDAAQPGEKPAASPADPEPAAAAQAFARATPDFEALPAEDLKTIGVDVQSAVATVRAAIPRILTLREAIAAQLPQHPVALLDRLDDFAQAAWFADLLFTLSTSKDDPFADLIKEAKPLRESLLSSAELLAKFGLIDEAKVKAIRHGHSNKDTAHDLVELSEVFEEAWPRVKNKSPVELEHKQRAGHLGRQLLGLIAVREAGSTGGAPEQVAERRVRAFSLLVKAYDETLRAVSYLRWKEGDAESFVPPAFKVKATRKARNPDGSTAVPPPVADDLSKSDDLPPI
jgi:hypothetical protein